MWTGPPRASCTTARQLRGRDGAQAVRRHADRCPGQRAHRSRGTPHDAREALRIVDEAALARVGAAPPNPPWRVEDGQQRQPDAGVAGGGDDARGQLRRVAVRRAVAIVVQVVELADVGEARLEHLGVGERGERLELVRRRCARRSGT